MDVQQVEISYKRKCIFDKKCYGISQEEPARKIAKTAQDASGRTKLHHAVKRKDATAVLDLCVNERDLVGTQDKYGQTALHVAARWGYADIGKTLLSMGAVTRVQDRFGRTPLHLAVIWGRWAAAEVCCGDDDTNSLQDRQGRTALYYATERGCKKIVRKLLAKTSPQNRKSSLPDHAPPSSQTENKEELISDAVKLRYKVGVSLVDVQDINGDTALHMAATGSHTTIIEMLLAAGSCTRIKNRLGRTPLQLALKCRRQRAAEILCSNDPHSLQDKEGRTALHFATRNGFKGIVKKLLFSDTHPHLMDNQGKSPLEFALKRGEDDLVKLIISSTTLNDIAIEWKDLSVDRDDIEYCFKLEADCIAEIQKMKETRINRTMISYYDIACRHVNKVAVYLENNDVRNVLFRGNLVQVFPIYAERIDFRVGKAEARKILKDQCLECFALLSENLPSLPRTSVDEILTYLNGREMQNFLCSFQTQNLNTCLKE